MTSRLYEIRGGGTDEHTVQAQPDCVASAGLVRRCILLRRILAAPGCALDNERELEKAQADARNSVAQQRSLAKQKKSEQRQAEAKVGAEAHYQTCLNRANVTYATSWAAECKRLAEKAVADRAECLTQPKLPKGYCDAAYRPRDASPNCILPPKVATALDGDLSEGRNRCQRERQAALQ